MILIDIVPNHSGEISESDAELITLTRQAMVTSFMSRHLKKNKAKRFIETMDLLSELADLFDNIVKLSRVVLGFATHCRAIKNPEIQSLADRLINMASVFGSNPIDSLDTTPFIQEYSELPDDDLRNQETSILYQRILNMTNLYSMIVRLSNELAFRVEPLTEGTLQELAKTVYKMTERVRYERSN